MAEPTWVTFITRYQAQPGRRMRPGPEANRVWTVKQLVMSGGRPWILWAEGGSLPIQKATQQRWQIEAEVRQ